MWKRRERWKGADRLISATEIACRAYDPEEWRKQYLLGVKPTNRAVLDAGTRHHDRKAAAERVAGGSIGLGQLLVAVAAVVLLILWMVWR
jgi:hypothetical protein